MKSKPDADILNTVYQAANMGASAISGLIERADDAQLKDALIDQLNDYHTYETEAISHMNKIEETPEDPGVMKKSMSRIGIKMNTAIDNTSSHLAEMVIQGSTMGITDLTSVINSNRDASEETQRLCSSLIHREQHNINRMKSFLGNIN